MKKVKVFLGGTVNGVNPDYGWRGKIMPRLKCEYFNPVVRKWSPEAQAEEKRQKNEECTHELYVITPDIHGFFSIAEVARAAVLKKDKAIFCLLDETFENSKRYSYKQRRSLDAVGRQVAEDGGKYFTDLDSVVEYLNDEYESSLKNKTLVEIAVQLGAPIDDVYTKMPYEQLGLQKEARKIYINQFSDKLYGINDLEPIYCSQTSTLFWSESSGLFYFYDESEFDGFIFEQSTNSPDVVTRNLIKNYDVIQRCPEIKNLIVVENDTSDEEICNLSKENNTIAIRKHMLSDFLKKCKDGKYCGVSFSSLQQAIASIPAFDIDYSFTEIKLNDEVYLVNKYSIIYSISGEKITDSIKEKIKAKLNLIRNK